LVVAVAALLVLSGVGSALAQEASPGSGTGSEIVPLAEVQVAALPPAPAFLGLARFSFPPGAATPSGADPGSVLVVVEAGEFVAALDGPAAISRGSVATPVAAPGAEVPLQPGDAVFVPAGTSSTFRNAGQSDASLIAVMIFPDDPFGSVARTSIADVAVDLLAGGMVESMSSPAELVLAVARLAPGSELPPSEAPGPAIGLLTEGSLSYTVAAGESIISSGARAVGSGRGPTEPAASGSEVALEPGDAFIEEAGVVSGLRNAGATDAILLVAFLAPAEGAVAATPAS
jgi:quercetin dioxygenase-like cupin family protein